MIKKILPNRHSLYLYLPQAIAEHFDLKGGDQVDVRIDGQKISLMPVASPAKNEATGAAVSPIKDVTA